MKRYYVYAYVDGELVFKGEVKAVNGKKAMKLAHRRWGDLPLDVIRTCYIADRERCTMRVKKK